MSALTQLSVLALVHCIILNKRNKGITFASTIAIENISHNSHFSFKGINIGVIRRLPSARRVSVCCRIALVGVSGNDA